MTSGERAVSGFTLIEVVVAIALMALMTVLAWRGIDSMVRTHDIVQTRSDEVRRIQVGLAQWQADLDQLIELGEVENWDWDGRVLRLTRQTASGDAIEVVGWTWRQDLGNASAGDWLRWQSDPVVGIQRWRRAWNEAQQWGRRPTEELQKHEVRIIGITGFQWFVHRGGAWSHPSSSGESRSRQPDDTSPTRERVPDAVRLMLELPDSSPLASRITVDWLNPQFTGDPF